MKTTEKTHYNLKRLHVWMAVASLALLAVTVWMLVADHRREWKRYQRTFRDRIEPWTTAARIAAEQSREAPDREELDRLERILRQQRPSFAKRLLRLPLIDALGRPLAIEQIWLPELTIDYNFRRVARFDRCVTCHQGIDITVPGDLSHLDFPGGLPHPYRSHPYRSHPRLDLFVGSLSPHPKSEFGCTICHDGQGSATEFKWASHTPDNPAARKHWRKEYGWFDNPHWDFPMLARRFAESRCLKCHHAVTDLEPSRRHPDPPAPKLLAGYHLVRQYGCFGCHEIKGFDQSGRSVGPDMRLEPNSSAAARQLSAAEGPPPGTMRKVGPSLRDLRDRVSREFLADWIRDPTSFLPNTRMPRLYGMYEHLDGRNRADARRFEAVEIRALVEYLLAASRSVEPLPAPEGVTEPPDTKRGKRLFEIHGCLACHKHRDFPQGQSVQGPELSNVGAKYNPESGDQWLAGWLRDPVHYSPRTVMPNALLEPLPLPDEAGMTDPAADVAAYLLGCRDWKPEPPLPFEDSDLDDLTLLHLGKTTSGGGAEAAEQLGRMTRPQKLQYLGRRTIAKRGCYGCHDVSGFEDAQPIGPALSDWGRKQESLLAFEQIDRFISADRDFFINALLAHRREGFIWQKLRAPRSFDYGKDHREGYNQRLTMGRFPFTQQEREAIITFVLGLVAEPPAEKYVYHPDTPQKAVVEGRKVLDKYGCAECHTLRLERWEIEFDPEDFEYDNRPPEFDDFAFLKPDIGPEALAASLEKDRSGLRHAEITGVPAVDPETGRWYEDDYDDQDQPLYLFNLWEPAAINGRVWTVGRQAVAVWKPQIARSRPPEGGAYARLLHPVVLEQAANPAMDAQAWGWLPPPLVHEGAKVQPAWLHDFLLAPYPIRPACVLRMPRYNMSAAEAGKLVDYFAAVSGVDFPYSSHPRRRTARLEGLEREQPGRLANAAKLLVDSKTDCVKCHLIGDLSPGGEVRTTLAPNLVRVGGRIRPEYLRRWLANPKSVLPYTAMTVNFPPRGEPLEPDLFGGNTLEQLDAVMDLLLNYDWYVKSQTSPRSLVEPDAQTESAAAAENE